jgi:anti-sigma regulatory factor (Ser/Thr protein kinase)
MNAPPPSLVFISYASEDRSVAESICAALESIPLRCWMAPRDIPAGEVYAGVIVEAISRCRIMVVVFSSSANASQQVVREVERAVANGRVMLLPFRVDQSRPSGAMEYFLSCPHWMDAMEPPLATHLEHLRQRVMIVLPPPGSIQSTPLSESTVEQTLERRQTRINASRPEESAEFIAVCRESLDKHDLGGRTAADTACVLWELLANAAEHGCGHDPTKEISATCEVRRTHVRIQVADSGPGFDAEETVRALTEHYDPGQKRGRGLTIVRFLSQRVTFTDSGRQVEAIVGVAPGPLQRPAVTATWSFSRSPRIRTGLPSKLSPRSP